MECAKDYDEYREFFVWNCCQKNALEDGCEIGRYVEPGENPASARRIEDGVMCLHLSSQTFLR